MAKTNAKYWELLVKSQAFPETHFELEKSEFTVGRIQNCDLSIRSESISRHHAKFSSAGGKVFIEDLRSSNGVYVNGKKIQPNIVTELSVGDLVGIGSAQNTLQIVSVEFAETPAAPFLAEAADPSKEANPDILAALPVPVDPERVIVPSKIIPLVELEAKVEAKLDNNKDEAADKRASEKAAKPRSEKKIEDPSLPLAEAAEDTPTDAPAPFSKKEKTNVDLMIAKQKLEDELKDLKRSIERAKYSLSTAREEEEAWKGVKSIERTQIESAIKDLSEKQKIIRESYEQNKISAQEEEAKVEQLATRLKEQEELIRLRSQEIHKLSSEKENLEKSITEAIEKEKNQKTSFEVEAEKQKQFLSDLEAAFEATKLKKETLQSAVADHEIELQKLQELVVQTASEFEEAKKKRKFEFESKEAEYKLIETKTQVAIEESKAAYVRSQRELDTQLMEYEQLKKRCIDKNNELQTLIDQHKEQNNELEKLRELSQSLDQELQKKQAQAKDWEEKNQLVLSNLQKLQEDFEKRETQHSEKLKKLKGEEREFENSLATKRASFEEELRKREQESFQKFEAEKIHFFEDAKRKIAIERLEASKKISHDRELFHKECELKKIELQKTFDLKEQEWNELQKQKLRKSQEEIEMSLEEFRKQKSREAELREKIFTEGILSSFFESAKHFQVQIPSHLIADFENRVRTNLQALHLASDEQSLKALEVEQPWLRAGKRISTLQRFQKPALVASLTFSAILGAYSLFQKGSIKEWAQTQNELKRQSEEAKNLQARLEATRPYETSRDGLYRETYTDNILFLDRYQELVLSEEYRNQWILSVNKFFTKEIPNGDRRSPQFLAREATLLGELIKLRQNINHKNPKPGIQRMRDFEREYLDTLEDLAGTPHQFKRIRKLEEDFFAQYLKSSTLRLPASTDSK